MPRRSDKTLPAGDVAPTDPDFFVQRNVGRLLEARVYRLLTREHTSLYGAAVSETAARVLAGRLPVLCADHRVAAVYPPEAAERLVELFRPNNAVFERIALLVGKQNATLNMQLSRIVREAGSAKRRVFSDPAAALLFLAEVLNPTEIASARQFLDEVSEP